MISVYRLEQDLQRGFVKYLPSMYSESDPSRFVDRDLLVWRWLESFPLANRMHRWVLATEEREIVGHLAAVPQFYRIMHHRVVAHMPADYSVLPQYGFYALPLVRTFFSTIQNCISWDQGEETVRILRRWGTEEAGRFRLAVKLLDVSKLEQLPASTPAFIPRLLNQGLRMVDKVVIERLGDGLEVETLAGFDESFDKLFDEVAAVVACLPEKDAAFLRWRYGPNSPTAPVRIFGVKDGEDLVGYAVLRITSQVPKEGLLLDLMTLPKRRDVARALCREAVSQCTQAGAYIIRYWFLESLTSPRRKDLLSLGFFDLTEKSSIASPLMIKFADRNLHKTARNAANWSYSMGDGIAACAGSFYPAL